VTNSTEKVELRVPSYALKRELAREINIRYKDANIFTEHKKGSEIFTVKKWRKRNYPTQSYNNNKTK
jgi:hypothetical protein